MIQYIKQWWEHKKEKWLIQEIDQRAGVKICGYDNCMVGFRINYGDSYWLDENDYRYIKIQQWFKAGKMVISGVQTITSPYSGDHHTNIYKYQSW